MKKGKTLFSKIIITVMMFVLLLGAMGNDVYASTILKKGMIGIDVSKHQGSIDWDRVKKSGQASFVIIRVGYGNDETSQDDEYAEYNMRECERLNIPYGVYLFSYALSEAEAYSEVEHIKRMLNGRKPPMGVYIDVEASSYYEQNGLEYMSDEGRRRITDYVKIILRGISAMGCSAGYYANVNYNEHVLYKDELSGYRWIAGYGDYQGYSEENGALIWQYSSNGSISGINARVDMDMLLQDFVVGSTSGGGSGNEHATPGWKQDSSGKKYQNADGTYVKNETKTVDGKTYYFDANGYMVKGWRQISGNWYYMDAAGVMQKSVWVGNYYLKSDGTMAKSEWVDNNRYYVDENGAWVKGKIPNSTTGSGSNSGHATPGWKQDSSGKKYQNADGTYVKNETKTVDGKTYYFDANGYMVKGWRQISGNWYYMDAAGVMQKSVWVGNYYLKSDGTMAKSEWVDNNRYYVDENGAWVKGKIPNSTTGSGSNSGHATPGWKQDSSGKKYQNADGTYVKNETKTVDGKTYYFDANGYMVKGWRQISGNWYYMDAAGVMQKSVWVGNYYLKSDGTMAKSEWVDSNRYYVDENGVWVKGKTK